MSSPLTGQVALSSTPQALSATAVGVAAFTIKVPATNTGTVWIGPAGVSSSTGYPLDPGESFEYERSTQLGQPSYQLGPADIFAVGSTGDRVGWFGSPG